MSQIRQGEIVISDSNYLQFCQDVVLADGGVRKRGLVPRNYDTHPVGCYGRIPPYDAVDLVPIPRAEWSDRLKDQIATGARLSDIRLTGNQGQIIPSLDQNGKGYCVPAGTKVRMADGTYKRIEEINLLDEVLSAEGNIRRVMQLHVREHDGEMVTLRLWGHSHLRLTPNHSVLTQRGYVPAERLTSTDMVAIPRYAPERSAILQTSQHVQGVKRRRRSTVIGQAEFATIMPAPADRGVKHVPDFVELNRSTGRIFGLWLAEGHTDKTTNSVVWSFNVTETNTLVAELVGLLRDEWGLEAVVEPGPASPNVVQVTLQGVLWLQMFESLCGTGCRTKRVHSDLMSGPKEFLEGLLSGWLAGDGHVKDGRQFGCSISKDLALAMFDIANFLGLRPSILREEPQQNKHAKVRQPTWKVNYPLVPSQSLAAGYDYRVSVEDGVTWRRVRDIVTEPFKGTVYNIGVEHDNSYVSEGIGVHNCWAHSSTSATMIARAVMNAPYVGLSAYAIACIIKSYADEGGWGAQSADFIASRGVPSYEFWPPQSMSKANDKPATWDNAKLHLLLEGWIDLQAQQYDRNLTWDQFVTCWLMGFSTVCDFNFWSHSVCGVDLVDGTAERPYTRDDSSGKILQLQAFDKFWATDDPVTAGYGCRIWNSWGDSWSDKGMGVLAGSKAVPDGGVAIRVSRPSIT